MMEKYAIVMCVGEEFVVCEKDGLLYLMYRNSIPRGWRSSKKGFVYMKTSSVLKMNNQTKINGSLCASFHGLPGKSLVVVGNFSTFLEEGVEVGKIYTSISYAPATVESDKWFIELIADRTLTRVFVCLKDTTAHNSYNALSMWIDKVNNQHRATFYQACEMYNEHDDKLTLNIQGTGDVLSVEKNLLPIAPFARGTIIQVRKNVLKAVKKYQEMMADKKELDAPEHFYEHLFAPHRTKVKIGEHVLYLPVEREVNALTIIRSGSKLYAKVSKVNRTVDDEIDDVVDKSGRVLISKNASTALFEHFCQWSQKVNKAHREHFYQEGKVISVNENYKYDNPSVCADKCMVASIKLLPEYLPHGEAKVKVLLPEYLPHEEAKVNETVYIQKTIINSYCDKNGLPVRHFTGANDVEFGVMPENLGANDEHFFMANAVLTQLHKVINTPINPCMEVYSDIEPANVCLGVFPESTCTCDHAGGASSSTSSSSSLKEKYEYVHDGKYEFAYYPSKRLLFAMGQSIIVPVGNPTPPSASACSSWYSFEVGGKSWTYNKLAYQNREDNHLFAQAIGKWLVGLYLDGVFK